MSIVLHSSVRGTIFAAAFSTLALLFSACGGQDPADTADAPEGQPPVSSSGAVIEDNSITGAIHEIHPPYGNLDTVLTAADLGEIGLAEGDRFLVEAHGNTLEVLWAKTYDDVAEGDGVAFLNWEDRLRIARNHANAAETLAVEVGDVVTIRPLP